MTEFCALRYRGRFIVTTATRPMASYVTTFSSECSSDVATVAPLPVRCRRAKGAWREDSGAERLPLIGSRADHIPGRQAGSKDDMRQVPSTLVSPTFTLLAAWADVGLSRLVVV